MLVILLCGGGAVDRAAADNSTAGKRYALTINGAVSVGAYEAGLNWALIELIKKDPQSGLAGVTGASAGSVNALLSALAYCDASPGSLQNNLFWDAWIPFDITYLFPDSAETEEEYRKRFNIDLRRLPGIRDRRPEPLLLSDFEKFEKDYLSPSGGGQDEYNTYFASDGLLSRKVSVYLTKKLRKIMEEGFKGGISERCRGGLNLGFTATKIIPMEMKKENIRAHSQKALFALTASAEGNKLVFRNQKLGGNGNWTASGKVLPLKEARTDARGETPAGIVEAPSVLKVLFASSAFPIAFSPVYVDYMDEGSGENHLFADGGVFDNSPIGLSLLQNGASHELTYLAVFPDIQRSRYSAGEIKPAGGGGGRSLIDSWFPFTLNSINSAMEAELFKAVNQAENRDLNLIATDRYAAITGTYLGHFGAFLDPSLREYDYYIGVYDGIHYMASMACVAYEDETAKRDCVINEIIHNMGKLQIDKTENARWLIYKVFREEYPPVDGQQAVDMPSSGPYTKMQVIHRALKEQGESFDEFIASLSKDKEKLDSQFGIYFTAVIDKESVWKQQLLFKINKRLGYIERSENSKMGELVLGGAEFGLRLMIDEELTRTKREVYWNTDPSIIPKTDDTWLGMLHYFPYELGTNASDGGPVIGYRPGVFFNSTEGFLSNIRAVEFPFQPYLGATRWGKSFASLGGMVRFGSTNKFVDFGIGVIGYKEWDESFIGYSDSKLNVSGMYWGPRIEAKFLKGHVSISYSQVGKTPDIREQHHFWTISFNDFNGLLYWLLKLGEIKDSLHEH